jgi:hypothetical protein
MGHRNARGRNAISAPSRRASQRIVGVFKETASVGKNDRPERKKVTALAQACEIDSLGRYSGYKRRARCSA